MFLRNIYAEALNDRSTRNLLYKLDHFPFCPASVVSVAVRFADEGTMPAVRSLDVGEIGISRDLSQSLRPHANKGIVGSMDDQSRNGDPVENIGSGGAGIIIVGARESAVVSGHAIVE